MVLEVRISAEVLSHPPFLLRAPFEVEAFAAEVWEVVAEVF